MKAIFVAALSLLLCLLSGASCRAADGNDLQDGGSGLRSGNEPQGDIADPLSPESGLGGEYVETDNAAIAALDELGTSKYPSQRLRCVRWLCRIHPKPIICWCIKYA